VRVSRPYLFSTVLLMLLAPALSAVIDLSARHEAALTIPTIGKWFVFWAAGVRLFTAGLMQSIRPAFTAETIFQMRDEASHVIVRELGFANMSLGLVAMVSLFVPGWRIIAAVACGLFLGLASANHLARRSPEPNQMIPMVTNSLVFLVLLVYLVHHALAA